MVCATTHTTAGSLDDRLENWLTCHLDDRDPFEIDLGPAATITNVDSWLTSGGLSKSTGGPAAPRRRDRKKTESRLWTRFRVAVRRSVAVVTVLDGALTREDVVSDLASDLDDLVAGGLTRLVLDLGGVEKLSSQVVAMLARLNRRCQAHDGLLKVCRLDPALAQVIDLAGLAPHIHLEPDVKSALEGAWPNTGGPQQLPVAVLEALRAAGREAASADSPPHPAEPEGSGEPPRLWLRLASGRAAGRRMPLSRPVLRIGRDPACKIRCNNALVSREHAVITTGNGLARIFDLGSRNGTFVNGQPVGPEGRELAANDHIAIGPISLFVDGPETLGDTRPAQVDDIIASWSEPQPGDSDDDSDQLSTQYDVRAEPAATPESTFRLEMFGAVAALTVRASRLGESEAEALRAALQAIPAPLDTPPRVVLNFEYVRHIDGRALAVLVAHLLRLERQGGGLRLCQVHDRVHSLLERARASMILEILPSLDEAVLNQWT
jgi:anti-anti-sigma factor